MHIGKIQTGSSYKRIFAIFLLIAVIFTVVVLYFVMGKAEIVIVPKASSKEVEFHFAVDANLESGKYERGLIPGQHIDKDITEVISITDLSEREVEDYARGKVTITNNSSNKRTLIIDTQLITDSGLVYLTDERVEVPSENTVDVSVRSEEKGKKYDIGPSHLEVKLLPHLKTVLFADSTEEIKGGAAKAPVIDKESLKGLLAKSDEQLNAKGLEIVKGEVREGLNLNEDSLTIDIKSYAPAHEEIVIAGNELIFKDEEMEFFQTNEFKIQIETDISAFAYNELEIIEVAKAKSQDLIDNSFDFQGLTGDATKIPITFDKSSPDQDKCYFTGIVKVDVLHVLPEEVFAKKDLAGFSKADILRHYQKLDIAEEISVNFWPVWIRNVPVNTNRVDITILENDLETDETEINPEETEENAEESSDVEVSKQEHSS